MKKTRFIRMASLFLAVAIALSGCGNSSTTGADNNPEKSSQSGEKTANETSEQKRDDIIFALNAEPTGLDPNNTWDTVTAVAQSAIYETLIAEKNGDSSQIEPMLAESWEISHDSASIGSI